MDSITLKSKEFYLNQFSRNHLQKINLLKQQLLTFNNANIDESYVNFKSCLDFYGGLKSVNSQFFKETNIQVRNQLDSKTSNYIWCIDDCKEVVYSSVLSKEAGFEDSYYTTNPLKIDRLKRILGIEIDSIACK